MTHAVSTGFPELDSAIGVGGYPCGHITEIFGEAPSGKTTLLLRAIASAQKDGSYAAFIDAEFRFNPDHARLLGVNLDKLAVIQPASGEDAVEALSLLAMDSTVGIIVLDSVAALIPKETHTILIGADEPLAHSHFMSWFLRKVQSALRGTNACILFANQIRKKLQSPMDLETTTGGRPLRMYSSVRIVLEPITRKRGRTNAVRATVVKNRLAPPNRSVKLKLEDAYEG